MQKHGSTNDGIPLHKFIEKINTYIRQKKTITWPNVSSFVLDLQKYKNSKSMSRSC
jgi:hypothetical protein